MSLQINPFENMPNDMIRLIFSYLKPEDLVNCSKINRQFYKFSNEQSLWQALFPEITVPQGRRIQDCLALSENQLLKRITQFAKSIQSGQNGSMTVQMKKQDSKLIIKLYDDSRTSLHRKKAIKTICFAKNIPSLSYHKYIRGKESGLSYKIEEYYMRINKPLFKKIENVLETRSSELSKQRVSQDQPQDPYYYRIIIGLLQLLLT